MILLTLKAISIPNSYLFYFPARKGSFPLFTGPGIAKTFQGSQIPEIFRATFLLRFADNAGTLQEKNIAQFSWHRNKKLAFSFASPQEITMKRISRKR
ncbi:MAG: hypothetical protein K9K81_06645 [Desulfobacteraceae bacterium]|nr:hypothetical protein [Desulfobacteraceae bacterium]